MSLKVKQSRIAYIFFIFFVIIFAVNCFYFYLSKKTWRGLVTKDSYHKGLDYNNTLRAVQKQKNLGWQVKIDYRRISERQGALFISPKDRNFRPILGAAIYATFRRPTQEGFDFVKQVQFVDGVYKTKIEFPLPGQWEIEVIVKKDDDIFQEVRRYVIN
jgi:nitrogen fixation protein FixH